MSWSPHNVLLTSAHRNVVADLVTPVGSGKGGKRLVDVIALVRHAIDPNTPLAPVGMTVEER